MIKFTAVLLVVATWLLFLLIKLDDGSATVWLQWTDLNSFTILWGMQEKIEYILFVQLKQIK